MKIFIAGASGAIGGPLVAQLAARGHEVVGTTRSPAKTGALRAAGAEPVVVDALDREALAEAVAKAQPDVVVHQLTALGGRPGFREVKRMAAATNRLRTEGTDNLLAAARAAGVGRVVAQSNAIWVERTGRPVTDEDGRLDPDPPASAEPLVAALRHLEDAVTGISWADGIAIRYGGFYGPRTGVEAAPGAVMTDMLRKRRVPIIGDGGGIMSFVHIEDAASATVAVIERGKPGIYHVADDDPAPARVALPALAQAIGAKPPRRVPAWLARMVAGQAPVHMMTKCAGISSEKIKRELGWTPRYPSWRTGFVEGLR